MAQGAKWAMQSLKTWGSALRDGSDRNIGRTRVEVPLFSSESPKYGLNWKILEEGWREYGVFKRVRLQILELVAMARPNRVSDPAAGRSVPSHGKRKRECPRARHDFRR